ncbi:hypothetical protein L1D55_12740 [Vibrio sp. Isolate22]|uniref:hypothetical protein n=1 Tax=Vibrio TaxID=662 RepID=UPI00036C208C|nr:MULTISPECIES: hypothetical protein [Vibrio]MCG9692598.1 hypothetical protein [Vibrio sp. Isolate22]CAK1825077.1 conserved hypothetical protein [Vibrio crassostreae]
MELDLTNDQVVILLHLVQTEMAGICGDRGYMELSKIRDTLERQLAESFSG